MKEGGRGDMMFIDLINIILLYSFYIYIMVYTIHNGLYNIRNYCAKIKILKGK